MLAVYVPTYGRPDAAQRLADNLRAATATPYVLMFVCDRDEDMAACRDTGTEVLHNEGQGYSDAIQTAYEADDSPFFIAANDDFDFQPGWDTAALAALGGGAQVAALNDGSPSSNRFRTIALVRRSYIEQHSGVSDMPRRVFYPYRHNYVDTEFYFTACKRGVLVECPEAVVMHRHPDWGFATTDSTYQRAQESLYEDAQTFNARAHLWRGA